MKFYLIDDDASVCNILKIIIQQKKLGEVCGSASNGVDALECSLGSCQSPLGARYPHAVPYRR